MTAAKVSEGQTLRGVTACGQAFRHVCACRVGSVLSDSLRPRGL